jgi:hypothetical protein
MPEATDLFTSPAQDPDPAEVPAGRLDALTSRKSESLTRLKSQLQQLRALVELQLELQSSRDAAASEPQSLPQPEPPAAQSDGPQPSATASEHSVPESAPPAANMLLAGQRIAAEALVRTPVDRIALGDNLFAAGEVALALEIYQRAEVANISQDERLWIRYQTACCQRRLGKRQEAERTYRGLAGMPNAGWYAAQSRWWLDSLQARDAIEQELTRIRETTQVWEQAAHAPQPP